MLTARERERCRELAAALDAGDPDGVYKRAEAAGFFAEEIGAIWDARRHVQERAAQAKQVLGQNAPKAPRPARIETSLALDDLDFWLDELAEPGDDDDGDTDQTTKLCPVCGGKGRDHSGDTCEECGGSGRLPLDRDDGGDDEEDGDERED